MITEDNEIQSVSVILAEGWRLQKFTANLMSYIPDPRWQKKWQNQVIRYNKHTKAAAEKLGIELVDFTGELFTDGLPVYPINLSDFSPEEELIVEMMMEPTIKVKDSTEIVHKGPVVLGRKKV